MVDKKRIHMAALTPYYHSEILGGTAVFVGARVPVRSLFDYLEGDETLKKLLHQFSSVKREQAITVLDAAAEIATGS